MNELWPAAWTGGRESLPGPSPAWTDLANNDVSSGNIFLTLSGLANSAILRSRK